MLRTLDAKLSNLSLTWKQWGIMKVFELGSDVVQCGFFKKITLISLRGVGIFETCGIRGKIYIYI